MSKYKAAKITGTTENAEVIVKALNLSDRERLLAILAKHVGEYVIYHPEAADHIDAFLSERDFNRFFRLDEAVSPEERFVAVTFI